MADSKDFHDVQRQFLPEKTMDHIMMCHMMAQMQSMMNEINARFPPQPVSTVSAGTTPHVATTAADSFKPPSMPLSDHMALASSSPRGVAEPFVSGAAVTPSSHDMSLQFLPFGCGGVPTTKAASASMLMPSAAAAAATAAAYGASWPSALVGPVSGQDTVSASQQQQPPAQSFGPPTHSQYASQASYQQQSQQQHQDQLAMQGGEVVDGMRHQLPVTYHSHHERPQQQQQQQQQQRQQQQQQQQILAHATYGSPRAQGGGVFLQQLQMMYRDQPPAYSPKPQTQRDNNNNNDDDDASAAAAAVKGESRPTAADTSSTLDPTAYSPLALQAFVRTPRDDKHFERYKAIVDATISKMRTENVQKAVFKTPEIFEDMLQLCLLSDAEVRALHKTDPARYTKARNVRRVYFAKAGAEIAKDEASLALVRPRLYRKVEGYKRPMAKRTKLHDDTRLAPAPATKHADVTHEGLPMYDIYDAFDVIKAAHLRAGHMKRCTTSNVAASAAGIPNWIIKAYVKTCRVCGDKKAARNGKDAEDPTPLASAAASSLPGDDDDVEDDDAAAVPTNEKTAAAKPVGGATSMFAVVVEENGDSAVSEAPPPLSSPSSRAIPIGPDAVASLQRQRHEDREASEQAFETENDVATYAAPCEATAETTTTVTPGNRLDQEGFDMQYDIDVFDATSTAAVVVVFERATGAPLVLAAASNRDDDVGRAVCAGLAVYPQPLVLATRRDASFNSLLADNIRHCLRYSPPAPIVVKWHTRPSCAARIEAEVRDLCASEPRDWSKLLPWLHRRHLEAAASSASCQGHADDAMPRPRTTRRLLATASSSALVDRIRRRHWSQVVEAVDRDGRLDAAKLIAGVEADVRDARLLAEVFALDDPRLLTRLPDLFPDDAGRVTGASQRRWATKKRNHDVAAASRRDDEENDDEDEDEDVLVVAADDDDEVAETEAIC